MSDELLEQIPGLDVGTGSALGAEAARQALDDARDDDELEDELETSVVPAAPEKPARGNPDARENAAEKTPGADRAPSPAKAKKEPKPETPMAKRKRVKSLKRDELATLYLDAAERAEQLERRVEDLAREAAVRAAVGNDVIDESVNDFIGDVIDLADSGSQFVVRKFGDRRAAAATALENDEREHLVKLWARYAKLVGGEYVQKSPLLAALVGTGALVLAKAMSYEAAKLDLEPLRPGVDASPATVSAAALAETTADAIRSAEAAQDRALASRLPGAGVAVDRPNGKRRS